MQNSRWLRSTKFMGGEVASFSDNPQGYADQIRSMRKDGKTYEEVREFFKKEYGIKLYDNTIAACVKKPEGFLPPGDKTAESIKKTRPYHKHKRGTAPAVTLNSTGKIVCKYRIMCRFNEICKPEICKFAEE